MARNAYVYDLEGLSELLQELAEQTFIEEEGDIPSLDPEEFDNMNKEFDKIKEKINSFSTTRRSDFLKHKSEMVPLISEIFGFEEEQIDSVINYTALGEVRYCKKCESTFLADDNCACYYHKEYLRENRKEIREMNKKQKLFEEEINKIKKKRQQEMQRETMREVQKVQRMPEWRRDEYIKEKQLEMAEQETPTLISEEEYKEIRMRIFGDDDI